MGMPTANDAVDAILIFGGDGTIHRHLGQLSRLEIPVLVVPAGSGNDFARSLGLKRISDSLTVWKKFYGRRDARPVDLGIINPVGNADDRVSPSRLFCCVAGVGLDGEVARRANALPRWLRGHGGYVLSLAPTIFTFAPLPIKISVEHNGADQNEGWEVRSQKPTMLAAFANTSVYGDGMKIAPRAKMDDGLLDICVVAGVDPFKLFWMFPSVYSGRHLKIREVEYFTAAKVRVETERPMDIYADGEFVCQTPVEIGIKPGGLKVITP